MSDPYEPRERKVRRVLLKAWAVLNAWAAAGGVVLMVAPDVAAAWQPPVTVWALIVLALLNAGRTIAPVEDEEMARERAAWRALRDKEAGRC